MNVLHFIGAFVAAGAEKFTVELVRELKRRGHDVGVVGLSSRRDAVGEDMLESLALEGIPSFVGPSDKLGMRTVLWLRRVLNETRPKTVHLHTPNTELAYFLATRLARSDRACVRTLHNTSIPNKRSYNLALAKNKVRATIACSSAVRDAMLERMGPDIEVIENGVDFHWPIKDPALRSRMLESLDMDPGKTHFLHVGRMDGESLQTSQKAHDVLIDAWRAGLLADAGAQLNLVGDGPSRSRLERRARNDRSIVFHGLRNDVAIWLQAADVFVMPSRHEGLPIAGIEALGTGIACLFSDIPPLQELGDGSVRRVKVDSVEELAAALGDFARSVPAAQPELAANTRRDYGMGRVAVRYGAYYSDPSRPAHPESTP